MVTGTGFYEGALKGANKVEVCGRGPEFECSVTSETYGELKCSIPQLVTKASQTKWKQQKAIKVPYTAKANSHLSIQHQINDGDLSTVFYASNNNCWVELDFGSNTEVLLTQIKYITNVNKWIKNYPGSSFEGYNAASAAWENIYTILDLDINQGWNTYHLPTGFDKLYSKIRYKGLSTKDQDCSFAEIETYGYRYYKTTTDTDTDLACPVYVSVLSSAPATLDNKVVYKAGATPLVSALNPVRGTTAGGTTLTITGSGFGTTQSAVTVEVDNVPCAVSAVSDTQIVCTTGKREVFVKPKLVVSIAGQHAENQGNSYLYIDLWSSSLTWGGESPPREGDTVAIPQGQNILLDVSTPVLNLVSVQGTLIFEDKDLTLDAHYIINMHGRIQIGTEDAPIQNKITITLHGKKEEKQLPEYGNKCIGVHHGVLDIHGKPRTPTFTFLAATAEAGATQVTMMAEVDW